MLFLNKYRLKISFFHRGGKPGGYLSYENMREFLTKQNDARGDPSGIDSYEQKARDLIRRYTQHDEYLREQGDSHFTLQNCFSLKFILKECLGNRFRNIYLVTII
jgi:hypothetical protein